MRPAPGGEQHHQGGEHDDARRQGDLGRTLLGGLAHAGHCPKCVVPNGPHRGGAGGFLRVALRGPSGTGPRCARRAGAREGWRHDHVESLTKKYGAFTAVDDVSFTAATGRVTGFLGPNGAGKSTTMRVMVGLTPATSGRVTIGGRDYRDLANPGLEVGVLLDASAQHAGRTGREILTIAQHTMGLPKVAGRRDPRPRRPHRRRGRPPGPQLLPRHAPAPRHRHRPASATPRC